MKDNYERKVSIAMKLFSWGFNRSDTVFDEAGQAC
jgi:hypothetical protein